MSWKGKIKKEKPETKKKGLKISTYAIILILRSFGLLVMKILTFNGIFTFESILALSVTGMAILLIAMAYEKDKRAMKNQ